MTLHICKAFAHAGVACLGSEFCAGPQVQLLRQAGQSSGGLQGAVFEGEADQSRC